MYASLILRPACLPDRAAQLGFVAALAVGEALSELVPGLGGLACKWPNDVLAGGRKIAGILLESEMASRRQLAFLVVGVGVNLVSAAAAIAEFRATSVVGGGSSAAHARSGARSFRPAFDAWVWRWRAEGFGPVRDAWRAGAVAFGEQVRVRLDSATLHGKFIDIDQQGILLLETEGGLQRISAGDVFPAASGAACCSPSIPETPMSSSRSTRAMALRASWRVGDKPPAHRR